MENPVDLETFLQSESLPEDASQLDQLRSAGEQAVLLQTAVGHLEETLKEAKSRLHTMRTKTLPDLLAEVQMTSFELEDGTSFEKDDFVSGSLPKKDPLKRQAALDELIKEGGEDLIKNIISVDFNKSEHNIALSTLAELQEKGFSATIAESVHPQTLMSFVREKLKKGEQCDFEKLGCYVGQVVKITMGEKS